MLEPWSESLNKYLGEEVTKEGGSLTPKTLISFAKDDNDPEVDHSILPHLDGKMWVFHDFPHILAQDRKDLTAIMGQLRSAFEGRLVAASGYGEKSYKSNFTILAAGTPEQLQSFWASSADMGERFLHIRMHRTRAQRRVLAKHANKMSPQRHKWMSDLCRTTAKAAQRALTFRQEQLSSYVPTDETALVAEALGDVLTAFRTIPIGWGRSSQELRGPEEAARSGQQLQWLGIARACWDYRSKMNESDYMFMRRIARDTIPPKCRRLLELIHNPDRKSISRDELIKGARLTSSEVSGIMQQYVINEVVKPITKNSWRETDVNFDAVEESGILKYNPKEVDPLCKSLSTGRPLPMKKSKRRPRTYKTLSSSQLHSLSSGRCV